MARRYHSNLKFLFKLHLRHCYGPTSEPRFSIKHGKVSPHSNSESLLTYLGMVIDSLTLCVVADFSVHLSRAREEFSQNN